MEGGTNGGDAVGRNGRYAIRARESCERRLRELPR